MKGPMIMQVLLFFGLFVQAQNNSSVELRLELRYDTVGLQERFNVTYVVENAQNAQIAPPNFDGFQQLGSSQSMRTNIVNGNMSSSVSYTYTLMPTALGYYSIPAATVYVGADTYTTPDASIIVVESTNHPTHQDFGFGHMPSLGFNDMDDLFRQQEELMRPYQDMFHISPDSLFQNPNQLFKDFGFGNDMMQLFKQLEDAFDFKMPPMPKRDPKEKTYKL